MRCEAVAEDDGSDELQLSTTPLRLLNAVDARISLLQVAPAPVSSCSTPKPRLCRALLTGQLQCAAACYDVVLTPSRGQQQVCA